MYSTPTEMQIIDLYAVGSEPEEFEINPLPEVPFVDSITLKGTEGRIVRVRGVFDSSTMVNTMCSSVYNKIKHMLSALHVSKCKLRMVNRLVLQLGLAFV